MKFPLLFSLALFSSIAFADDELPAAPTTGNPEAPKRAATVDTLEIDLLPNEGWFGGFNSDANDMPFDASTDLTRDLYGRSYYNQSSPLLISDQGRWIWSDKPFRFTFKNGKLRIESDYAKIQQGRAGSSLREAFLAASAKFFPPSGKIPDPRMFIYPQYNTWIELMYDQEQEAILKYARTLIDQGYPKGVLMIDDNWQEDYGVFKFSGTRFSDPRKMMAELREMGFPVMLWVCPFVSPDSAVYRDLEKKGYLLVESGGAKGKSGKGIPAMVRWWNGVSAVLDLSNPGTMEWFKGELQHLVDEYGVDGYKLDAGDADYYTGNVAHFKEGTLANDQTELFTRVGLDFPLNEYRAAWKMGGQPLAQRLKDKGHRWDHLGRLIPDILSQGLLGHPFTCPDMIGGGEFNSFLNAKTIDEELVVRSAQVHALMPMMQFSVAPWRILSEENNAICRKMAELHVQLGPEIVKLAEDSAKSGEPIARSMEYQFPHQGYAAIRDQFLLGPDILVAPVIKKGARSRKVIFPEGTWLGDDGSTVKGPVEVEIQVPLERVPYFRRNH